MSVVESYHIDEVSVYGVDFDFSQSQRRDVDISSPDGIDEYGVVAVVSSEYCYAVEEVIIFVAYGAMYRCYGENLGSSVAVDISYYGRYVIVYSYRASPRFCHIEVRGLRCSHTVGYGIYIVG